MLVVALMLIVLASSALSRESAHLYLYGIDFGEVTENDLEKKDDGVYLMGYRVYPVLRFEKDYVDTIDAKARSIYMEQYGLIESVDEFVEELRSLGVPVAMMVSRAAERFRVSQIVESVQELENEVRVHWKGGGTVHYNLMPRRQIGDSMSPEEIRQENIDRQYGLMRRFIRSGALIFIVGECRTVVPYGRRAQAFAEIEQVKRGLWNGGLLSGPVVRSLRNPKSINELEAAK